MRPCEDSYTHDHLPVGSHFTHRQPEHNRPGPDHSALGGNWDGPAPAFIQRMPRTAITSYGSLVQVDTRRSTTGTWGGRPASRRRGYYSWRGGPLGRRDLIPAVELFSFQLPLA